MDVPELFIVTPPPSELNPETEMIRRDLHDAAKAGGLDVKVVRAQRVADSGAPSRKLLVLDPWDAHKIYVDSHRRWCAAVQLGSGIRVRVNSMKDVSTRNSITLEQFVRYKALLVQRGQFRDVEDVLAQFDAWRTELGCEGDRDPRVLPLHCFSPSSNWDDLAESKARFERQHGGPNRLTDENSRAWNRTTAHHGQDALTVGGVELQTGFHWDVQSDSTSSMSTTIEVWKFDSGAYANVYPDGAVRQGQRAGRRARCVHRVERPADLSTPTKNTSRRRKRRR